MIKTVKMTDATGSTDARETSFYSTNHGRSLEENCISKDCPDEDQPKEC